MFCSVVLIYAMHVCCFSGTVEYMTHICFTRLDVHMSQASVVVFFVFFISLELWTLRLTCVSLSEIYIIIRSTFCFLRGTL